MALAKPGADQNRRHAEHERDDNERRHGLKVVPADPAPASTTHRGASRTGKAPSRFCRASRRGRGRERGSNRAADCVPRNRSTRKREREEKGVRDSVFFNSEIHATDSTRRRVNREKKSTQPRQPQIEFAQETPDQQRADEMEDEIGQVIAQRIQVARAAIEGPASSLRSGSIRSGFPAQTRFSRGGRGRFSRIFCVT